MDIRRWIKSVGIRGWREEVHLDSGWFVLGRCGEAEASVRNQFVFYTYKRQHDIYSDKRVSGYL